MPQFWRQAATRPTSSLPAWRVMVRSAWAVEGDLIGVLAPLGAGDPLERTGLTRAEWPKALAAVVDGRTLVVQASRVEPALGELLAAVAGLDRGAVGIESDASPGPGWTPGEPPAGLETAPILTVTPEPGEEAVRAAIASGDAGTAAARLAEIASTWRRSGHLHRAATLFRALPPTLDVRLEVERADFGNWVGGVRASERWLLGFLASVAPPGEAAAPRWAATAAEGLALTVLAECLAVQGRHREAFNRAEQAAKTLGQDDPLLPRVHALLQRSALASGRLGEEARERWRHLESLLNLPYLDRLAASWGAMARERVAQGVWGEARRAFERAAEINALLDWPFHALETSLDQAEMCVVAGGIDTGLGLVRETLGRLEVQANLLHARAFEVQGDLSWFAGDRPSATAAWERALALAEALGADEACARVGVKLGEALVRAGQLTLGWRAFRRGRETVQALALPTLSAECAFHEGVLDFLSGSADPRPRLTQARAGSLTNQARAALAHVAVAHRRGETSHGIVQEARERLARFPSGQPFLSADGDLLAGARPLLEAPLLEIETLERCGALFRNLRVHFPFKKALETMLLLALRGPQTRDALEDALFDGFPARDYTKSAIKGLRSALEAGGVARSAVRFDGERYSLEWPFALDFERSAGATLGGPSGFLADIESAWAAEERARRVEALVREGAGALATRPGEALQLFALACRLDPECLEALEGAGAAADALGLSAQSSLYQDRYRRTLTALQGGAS